MLSSVSLTANGDDQGEDYVVILTGILVMQDIQLSMLMGILPVLAGHHEPAKSSYTILPNQGLIHHWLHGESHSSSKGKWCYLHFNVTSSICSGSEMAEQKWKEEHQMI